MGDLSLSSTARVSDDAVFRELEGEAVVLNLAQGTYYGLDEVGTRIWQLIQRFGRLDVVRDSLIEEYDVEPSTAERDLLDLVGQLAARGLVELEP
jgi:hypothetical protein